MINPQYSLQRNAFISGTGLHTGLPVDVSILPAPEDSGIRFRRVDLPDRPEVPADIDAVVDTHRGTTLSSGEGVTVRTVEHLLAALTGAGIWNCVVELDAEELPACDGSSRPFLEVIREAGRSALDAPQEQLVIDREIRFECRNSGSRFEAQPAAALSVDITLEFPHLSSVPTQHVAVTGLPESFEQDVAPSRTFCHTSELSYLIGQGLARGGSLENAVVIPSRALQINQNGPFVFVVKEDKTVDMRPVEVGPQAGDITVILEGAAPGETVVTDGQLRLSPGSKVAPKGAKEGDGKPAGKPGKKRGEPVS